MKIALVTPYDYPYPGGVTEHIRHLDRAFRARGHRTRILAASSERTDVLASNVVKLSGEIEPVPVNGSTARLTFDLQVPSSMERVLKRERFDVVHIHEPAASLLSLSALYYSSAINVGTFHAYIENDTLYTYARPLMEWVSARLDGRVFVSPAVRDSMTAYLSGDCRVIPNGIDYERFAARGVRPIEEFDDGRPNILFVGRLDERKGFQHLARAYSSVKQAIHDARLLVVGAFGREDKARLNGFIRDHDRRDIHFIGRVLPEELPRYYRSATVFCAPSTGSESFGIVLLEAMAAGVPVVASSIAGYRGLMQDQVQGRLFPVGDEPALAETLIRLLQDPRRRAQMGAQGRATAARYDWQVVAPRVLDYYEELIRRRARRGIPAWRGAASNRRMNGVNVGLRGLMNVVGPLLVHLGAAE